MFLEMMATLCCFVSEIINCAISIWNRFVYLVFVSKSYCYVNTNWAVVFICLLIFVLSAHGFVSSALFLLYLYNSICIFVLFSPKYLSSLSIFMHHVVQFVSLCCTSVSLMQNLCIIRVCIICLSESLYLVVCMLPTPVQYQCDTEPS